MSLAKPLTSARKPASPNRSLRRRSDSSLVVPEASASSLEVLAKISNMAHVRVTVNDLVAYEYVDEKTHGWRWGLGTVASIPAPRLVQLMLWEGSGGELPPDASPVSAAERAAAVRRLGEIESKRQAAEEEMEDLNKTIVVEQAHYNEGRAAYEADAQRAVADAVEVQKAMKQLKESDWREIRSYVKPPDMVKLIMEATLITLGEKTYDWNYILKVIRQRDFMKRLMEFDSLSIGPSARRLLRKEYLSNPRFTHADAMEGSRALGVLERWVSAQLVTIEATSDMVDYDKTRARDKKKLDKMEDKLRARRQEVEAYKDEESRLKAQLGDAPIHLDLGVNDAAATSAPPPKEAAAAKTKSEAKPKGRAGAPPLHENVHGGANTWAFTEVSKVVLLSSILVNYDKPEATVITLTPEQLEQLKEALAARAAPFAEMQKADNKIKDLEDDLQDARGGLADALQNLADAKADQAEHNAQLASKDREIDDAKEEAAAAAAAAAKDAAPEADSTLPPAEDLLEALAEKDAEVEDLKAALAEEKAKNKAPKDKKNGARGGPAAVELEKEPVAQDIARDGSTPHLFHAADDRELAKIIDRLEKEIRILRNESAAANDVLEGVNGTIDAHPSLRKFLEEDS